ncbi:MAG: Hsp20/alpha crystallin family protein [Gammaproteobacteria bacterium]
MALIRYNPNRLFDDLNRDFFGLMPRGFEDKSMVETGSWIPQVDIKEEADRFLVFVDVPGVDPNQIEVSWENKVLTVKGERKTEKKEETNGYTRVERSYGTFYRQFTLPETADQQNISAKSKHGVLEIVIPKREKEQGKKINIKVED